MSRFLAVWLLSLLVSLSELSLSVIGKSFICDEDSHCDGKTFHIKSGTDFSITCDGPSVCYRTKIVVDSSCTLKKDGIECDEGNTACGHATIVVFSSDLTTAGGRLDCASIDEFNYLCEHMNLTLVDSKITLKCRVQDCEDFNAYLYGNSTLTFFREDDVSEESQLYFGEVTVHLFPGSTLIDNGYTDYSLVQLPTTTFTPTSTQESTQLPTMISTTTTTTTTMPSTTKALVTSTSSTMPIETTTSTLLSSTEFNTTFESTAESTTTSTTTTTAMTSTITALPKPQSGDGVSKRYKIVVPVLAAVCCVVLVVICVAVTGWYFCWKKVKTLEQNVAGMEQKAEKLEIQIARGNMTADDHWDDLGLETESDEERCAILWPAAAKRISTMDDDDSDVELEYTPKPKR